MAREQKKLEGLFLLIIFLMLIIGVVGVYGFYKKKTPLKNNLDNTIINNDELKIDKDKAWVYKANYNINLNEDSYTLEDGTIISLNNLVLPYLNIKSDSAQKINEEIKVLNESLIKDYNNFKEEHIFYTTSYTFNVIDNFVSIVITKVSGGTSIPVTEYYTYNVDIETGSLIDYYTMYENFGFTEEIINSNLYDEVFNYQKSIYSKQAAFDQNSLDYLNTINDYNNMVQNNTIKYYIDKNKNINVILKPLLPTSASGQEKIFTLKIEE